MSHIQFAGKGQAGRSMCGIREEFGRGSSKLSVYGGEDLCDGIGAFCLLAKHIFVARLGVEFDTGHTSPLLTAVVLFLHHEVEFVKSVHPRAILLLIVGEGLEESDHGDAAFVF